MVQLILAAFFFFAIHGLVSATGLRRVLVARLGENAYRGLFSLASAGGLAWLILAKVMGLELFWVQSGVMLAAMPTATNAFVLAQRYHNGVEEVSAAVLLSTLVAALAFPVTAWLVVGPVAVP